MFSKSKIVYILAVILIAAIVLFGIRFIIGGSEDDWICVDGKWIEHGVPSAPMPTEVCK